MEKKVFAKLDSEKAILICQNEWTIQNLQSLGQQLDKITWPSEGKLIIDGSQLTKMDSAGAWLLDKRIKQLEEKRLTIQQEHFTEQYHQLLNLVEEEIEIAPTVPHKNPLSFVARVGKHTYIQLKEFRDYLDFIGRLAEQTLSLFLHPSRLRFNSLASAIDKTGFESLPIIALMSFMIGIVIAYQMGNQLRTYGANIFIVNLLGYSILREFGPLLSAIMIAGRTGSSFAAQLGIMKINQEIDALNTMGVMPGELLVLPRILGLVIALPLLTMWSDIFGVLGGMVMANNLLGVTWIEFLQRFQHEIPVRALIIGLAKAPVFALIISSIGCFQGMRVKGSAESVGQNTTRSVVLAIFFIIISDALFSILFSKANL